MDTGLTSQNMDEEDLLMLCAAAAAVIALKRRHHRRSKHQRQIWSRPWLLEMDSDKGISHFVRYELTDDISFQGFLRMPANVFEELLQTVAPCILKCETVMRESIKPEDMLIVTLRYLATGGSI